MTTVQVVITKGAEREIRKLPKSAQIAVVKALEKLQRHSRPEGVKKLGGHPEFYRIRAGNYRIIYAIRNLNLIIVLVVRDRKDAYRGLENLDEKLAQAMAFISASLV